MQQYPSQPYGHEHSAAPERVAPSEKMNRFKSYLFDSSHLFLEIIGFAVFSVFWYFLCRDFIQFFVGGRASITLFSLPIVFGISMILFKVFLKVKSFFVEKLHDDLALCELSEMSDAHLEAYIKKHMIEKRALTLHFFLYIIVNMSLAIFLAILNSSFYIDLSLLFVFSICVWGIAVVMHFIIFSTKVSPMKINKALQKARRKFGRTEYRLY